MREQDSGGLLTIDHYHPTSKEGSDDLENLVYTCSRCNLYKQNYWPEKSDDLPLWNPRQKPRAAHFLQLDDGLLVALTKIGEFTIKRLRLNRPPLVNYRQHRRKELEVLRQLTQYRDLVDLLWRLNEQYSLLVEEQQKLLQEQQQLLRRLLQGDD